MPSATTLHTGQRDPAEEIVSELHTLVDSAFTAFCEFHEHEDGLRYGRIISEGDGGARDHWRRIQFQPSNAPWDPARVSPGERSKPVFIAPEDVQGTRVWREMYEPVGLEVARRILVYDEDTFVGWLGVHRAAGAGTFTAEDEERFDRATARLCSQVIARSRLLHGGPDSMCVLVRDAGHVEATCTDAAAWLSRWDGARQALVDIVRAERGGAVMYGMKVRVVRLVGDGGGRHLCLLTRPRLARLSPLADLTPTQAQVAELAALGATAKEIADHLGNSPATVRVHLRAVYRRLEVGSRVELAERLAPQREDD